MAIRNRIANVVVAAGLAALTAAPAFAQLSPQRYQAMSLQGQALNVMYGLGHPSTMTHPEYRALLIRSAALNERYGLPTLGSDEIARLFGTGLMSG